MITKDEEMALINVLLEKLDWVGTDAQMRVCLAVCASVFVASDDPNKFRNQFIEFLNQINLNIGVHARH